MIRVERSQCSCSCGPLPHISFFVFVLWDDNSIHGLTSDSLVFLGISALRFRDRFPQSPTGTLKIPLNIPCGDDIHSLRHLSHGPVELGAFSHSYHTWLVVWNIFYFPIYWSSQLTFMFFRRFFQPPTRYHGFLFTFTRGYPTRGSRLVPSQERWGTISNGTCPTPDKAKGWTG